MAVTNEQLIARRKRRRWFDPRYIRPDVGAAILLLPVTFAFCFQWGVRPNLDVKPYLIVGLLLILLAAIPTAFLFVVGGTIFKRWGAARRARVNAAALVANMLFLILMSWTYSHMKAGVLTSTETCDPILQRIDLALCNGHSPVELARQWIPDWFATPLSVVYMAFFPVLIGCIFWLAFEGEQDRSDDLTCAIILAYYIGVLMYHLVPSYGPAYTINNSLLKGVNDSLVVVQQDLLQQVQEVQRNPSNAQIRPWKYIAAFPSLHVTGVLIAIWYMRKHRLAYWSLCCFGVLTTISTVFFGWHYLSDWVGGIVVAAMVIWITGMFRLAQNVKRRLRQSTETQVVRLAKPVFVQK